MKQIHDILYIYNTFAPSQAHNLIKFIDFNEDDKNKDGHVMDYFRILKRFRNSIEELRRIYIRFYLGKDANKP